MIDRTTGSTTQTLKIHMFGALELTINGRPLKTRTPKDFHVLAYLLTHHDAEVDRDHLAALFWNIGRDGTPIGATDRLLLLSRCLSELGAALGEERVRLQKPGSRTLRFVTEGAGIDLATFDTALAKGDAASLEKAACLYRSAPLLEGWDERWVVEARGEIQERYMNALSGAAHRARLANDPAAALRWLRLALAIDPWREPLLRGLLELQTEMRRFDAVRRQIEAFCRLTEQEGREPEPETEQCFRRLNEEAEQFETSPRAGKIPSPLSSFVPREEEVAQIEALLYGSVRVPEDESKATDTPVLQHSRPRLLTLTGSGGVGKSRLAIEVARHVREDYYDRAWFVDLSALSDGALVARTVASVLGLREEVGRSIEETLTEFLRPKCLLLLLDNCEHLVQSCARLAADLLSACPHLCILATSREKLGLAGEEVWRVPSLAFPDPSSLIPHPSCLLEYGAVQLFITRASLPQQPFKLTAGNAEAVATVCARLDGIPLAIELATAYLPVLSVEQIDARLGDLYSLLDVAHQTTIPRHQTLRAVLDWSHALLTPPEQALLRRISVFAGGWTLEAAEHVCIGEEIEFQEVADRLVSLVNKSLVTLENQDQQPRFRLLETVRQYALARLGECRETESVRERHQAFFVTLAEAAEPHLCTPESATWLHRLEMEHSNLRAALGRGEPEACLRISGALWPFWMTRGYLSAGLTYLDEALRREGTSESTPAREKALRGAGFLAWFQGNQASARSFWEECLSIQRELGDKLSIAGSLHTLGLVARDQGDYEAAAALFKESLAIRREVGDKWGIAASLTGLGIMADRLGDYVTASAFHKESLEIRRELGDRLVLSHSLNNLGDVARQQGEHGAARSLLAESLAMKWELRYTLGIAVTLEAFAHLAVGEEQLPRAVQLWAAAKVLREAVGGSLTPDQREKYDRNLAEVRAALGQETFEVEWSKGEAMTMEQSVGYALEPCSA